MDNDLKNRLKDLQDKKFFDELVISRGIEKEFFRVNQDAQISQKPHPKSLGSALTNRFITTDFAEAQLELVTPVYNKIDDLFDFLSGLHEFVASNIDEDEMLWPFSMPPYIENESDINLGYYHQSNIGLLKHVYRRGLKVRYGSTMQCVSGMHYNFSLDTASISKLTQQSSQESFDEAYLGLIRNFKRLFWFVLSEFGQTNIVDKSFVKNRRHQLDELNESDMFLEHATSLRMSEIGYQSKAQKSLDIKYNSLEGFLRKIKKAIEVPYKEFSDKGLKDSDEEYQQISDGIIQIENEYYDSIRPKRSSSENMRPYDLLKNLGIEYLEIRGVDISPSDITGMSKHHIRFLDLILIYCLILPSPKITSNEKKEIDSNEYIAIYSGRDKEAKILVNGDQIKINEARDEMIGNLRSIAKCMNDSQLFDDSIDHMLSLKKGELSQSSFHDYGVEKAKTNLELLKSAGEKNIDSIK